MEQCDHVRMLQPAVFRAENVILTKGVGLNPGIGVDARHHIPFDTHGRDVKGVNDITGRQLQFDGCVYGDIQFIAGPSVLIGELPGPHASFGFHDHGPVRNGPHGLERGPAGPEQTKHDERRQAGPDDFCPDIAVNLCGIRVAFMVVPVKEPQHAQGDHHEDEHRETENGQKSLINIFGCGEYLWIHRLPQRPVYSVEERESYEDGEDDETYQHHQFERQVLVFQMHEEKRDQSRLGRSDGHGQSHIEKSKIDFRRIDGDRCEDQQAAPYDDEQLVAGPVVGMCISIHMRPPR
ncbi:protein of unknown function [Pseudodesulfovibrio profundus]|uniref:Uncharacterized protein n=1 Tax=Pseudodesulfovibrio profundus TaxID=57320 RepID=A0A2C8FA49_9BACT|nr:protein of unknown function [Pseudodesulfovibrio profundus]